MARGEISGEFRGVEAFWHPSMGLVVIIFMKAGRHWYTRSYGLRCDEAKAVQIMASVRVRDDSVDARFN